MPYGLLEQTLLFMVGARTFLSSDFQNHFFNQYQVEQSLLVTGFGYEHDDPWATNMELFKEFTDVSRVKHSFLSLVT